jgi:hypothetical protein
MRFSYRMVSFSPIDFEKLNSERPWVFFDHDRNTMVLSPADNFLVSEMDDSSDGEMRTGIDSAITSLPSNFTHRTLMVFGNGINRTLDAWGNALQKMNHKQPIANDAKVVWIGSATGRTMEQSTTTSSIPHSVTKGRFWRYAISLSSWECRSRMQSIVRRYARCLGAFTGLEYDASTHVFSFALSPGENAMAKVSIH